MPDNQNQIWYAAFKAKDPRFDGRLFVGVSSTGIYCRPICRAKMPKAENCSFYTSAAEAEQAGFRPCLICRPELAPGNAPADASSSLAHRAARLLEELCGSEQSIKEAARLLGCTDRRLRRAFKAEYGVSPVQYLQACRLLLAPTALRRQAAAAGNRNSNVTLSLGYRPPYHWQQMLEFLAMRAIPGVEAVRNGEYLRTVRFETGEGKQIYGWIRVGHQPQKNALTVTADLSLLPVLTQVLARVRHLFDLYCDPDAVFETLASMNDIRPGLCVSGVRVPGSFDHFEMAVRAVLGQQITVKGARTLAARLVEAYGVPIQTEIEGLTHVFPSPEEILALDGPIGDHLGPLGITGSRANTILELARVFVQKDLDFSICAQPEIEVKKLMTIPGIGAWTAQYIAMRAMGWPDAFPHTDYGVKKALEPRTSKEILDLAEAWRPWRSYATINLWNSL